MDELETIELILEEANSYGLRNEVEKTAQTILEEYPKTSTLVAYQLAFDEWVK